MLKRYQQNHRASMAVQYGGHFDTGGIVADDMSQDISGQAQQVLVTLENLLALAGLCKNDLVRIQIWLSDITTFEQMNAVYDAWVADSEKPLRATVESRLADPGYLIEIQAFAYKA